MKHTLRSHLFGTLGFMFASVVGWAFTQVGDHLVSRHSQSEAQMPAIGAERVLHIQPQAACGRSERLDALCRALRTDERKWRFSQAFCSFGAFHADEIAVVCGDWQRASAWQSTRPPAAFFSAHELRTVSAATACIAYYDDRGDAEEGWRSYWCDIGDGGYVLTSTKSGPVTIIFRRANIVVDVSGGRRDDVDELARLVASHLP
jgi:hypothetical protein